MISSFALYITMACTAKTTDACLGELRVGVGSPVQLLVTPNF